MRAPWTPIQIDGIPEFWERARSSRQALLLLDYDGTLAPFHPDRMMATPINGALQALNEIATLPNTTIALVSGRPVAELLELTSADHLTIAGTHGFELYTPDDGYSIAGLPDGLQPLLNDIEEVAAETVGRELTERKVATVALHTRKLDPGEATSAEHAFRARVAPMTGKRIELRDFDGGVEARVIGRDKGVVVRELIERGGSYDFVVYVGDDDTDEDAFRALPDSGVGIKVGRLGTRTAAAGRLDDCASVLQLLTDWIATKRCQ